MSEGSGGTPAAALWVAGAGRFRGSAFHLGGGLVVSAAHVVLGGEPLSVVAADGGAHPVADVWATPAAAPGEDARFHPFPDLALLTVPGCAGLPAARPAADDPAPGTAVTALGYAPDTPSPGIQPDTLSLRVGGVSGAYLRVLGDGVREGFSGSMLVADRTGLVVGVLKASRSYRDVRGGWFTPVTALRDFLGPRLPAAGQDDAPPGAGAAAESGIAAESEIAAASVPAAGSGAAARVPAQSASAEIPPTDAELVDALLAFPALARADHRYDLLDRMGQLLGLPHSFEVEERSGRREHLYRLVLSCRQYRDERAALRSLYTAMEETAPYDKALDRLRALVGRAAGSREDA
jgi:hypothetical protein